MFVIVRRQDDIYCQEVSVTPYYRFRYTVYTRTPIHVLTDQINALELLHP
jgi:hypothetical protein